MAVTKRFVILACLSLPLLALSAIIREYTPVFVMINILLFGLLALDFFISVKSVGNHIEIMPQREDTLYFKADNTISFFVRNNLSESLTICLKDSIPDRHFVVLDTSLMSQTIHPDDEAQLSYTVRPTKRGAYMFPKVYGYIISKMGLCRLYFERELPRELKVYPNLRDLSRYRLITQNKHKLPPGTRTIRLRGMGMEFEGLREYIEGDDFRSINWKATARDTKMIVNKYQTEKNQPIFILIDTGRPMSYNVKGYKKLDYAINAALILSDIVNQQGDNSGLMVFDTRVHTVIQPGKGSVHRSLLMEALYHIQDTRSTSDYEGAFIELLNRQKRQSLIFLFTDFESPEQGVELSTYIRTLKRRHTPFIILMENDSLKRMTMEGTDNSDSAIYERAVALEFLEKRRTMIKVLNAHGIACTESPAEDFALTAVNSYLKARR